MPMLFRDALKDMILSASGWRKIFAPDGEHGTDAIPDWRDSLLALGMGAAWGQWLCDNGKGKTVLVAIDTRPTGPVLAEMVMRGLEYTACEVLYMGVAPAPEIMARSSMDEGIDAFAYVSASHNPVGHNGVKFGMDGGLVGGDDAVELIRCYRRLIQAEGAERRLEAIADTSSLDTLDSTGQRIVCPRAPDPAEKRRSLVLYREFLEEIASGPWGKAERQRTIEILRKELKSKPLGIVADLNGSARTVSVDREFLEFLGVDFRGINTVPGQIDHAILPEGEAMEPCRKALEVIHSGNAAVSIGYVTDNDGDRGNLVFWDEKQGVARCLDAQEVFALAALAELAVENWQAERLTGIDKGSFNNTARALVVNGPTSHRIRDIARAYGTEVHEVEVGEANVVNRARELRAQGYRVRLMGEGSNGGCITHPAAVRDPLNMVTALLKLLRLPSLGDGLSPFEDWCVRIGRPLSKRNNFGLSDVIDTLPCYATTPISAPRAVIRLQGPHPEALKTGWKAVFQRQWAQRAKTLRKKHGFADWVEINNEGTSSREGREEAVKQGGGLKIVFRDATGQYAGFLWMRASGTEAVFRVAAEIRGGGEADERDLVDWHRGMVFEAEKGIYSASKIVGGRGPSKASTE